METYIGASGRGVFSGATFFLLFGPGLLAAVSLFCFLVARLVLVSVFSRWFLLLRVWRWFRSFRGSLFFLATTFSKRLWFRCSEKLTPETRIRVVYFTRFKNVPRIPPGKRRGRPVAPKYTPIYGDQPYPS